VSKRINVVLPDETMTLLDRVTRKGTRSTFISRAVSHYVGTHSRGALRKKLAAGYRANAERSLAVAAEWFPLEEEASRKKQTSPELAKATKRK
jgi:metal-responsive CopG/Arc/MetJ family transcriptional regulator